MPGHHRFRCDQDGHISLIRIQFTVAWSGESVRAAEPWPRLLPFESGELLPQDSRFQAELVRGTKNAWMYVTTANMSEPIAPMPSNGFQRS